MSQKAHVAVSLDGLAEGAKIEVHEKLGQPSPIGPLLDQQAPGHDDRPDHDRSRQRPHGPGPPEDVSPAVGDEQIKPQRGQRQDDSHRAFAQHGHAHRGVH